MSKQKILFYSVLGICFLLTAFFLFTQLSKNDPSDTARSMHPENEDLQQNANLQPLGDQSQFWDAALSPFREDSPKSYLEIIEDLKTGKINFVWELWALRRKCDAGYTAEQCNQTILTYIDQTYESPGREKLRDLFESYFRYEEGIRKLDLSGESKFEDRYEILKNKRREIMGDEKSDLVFGMEESQVQFLEGSANFIQSSKNMNPEERVKKFDTLKRKTYGSYYDSIVSREDKFDHYQTEIGLREREFAGLNAEEKEKKLTALDIKYFGKERASELAKIRKEESEQAERISNYEKQEKEFLRLNPNLSDKDKEKKLKELRVKAFGEEEAEAYERRKMLEEASE
ncbi:proteobacterial lipase chaperone protein [Leptospira ryugenii]|uniref:Lipase helper protein n=1 Tax=Leptospira ryugenii TaxID=1917863 RepID=A0A2P2E121_9LEPT|nr:lipase chaperone [Leptospira ryugenii]GBF50580.1 proteobacterial lipase chaperone protein [Leptospira ryugenii]